MAQVGARGHPGVTWGLLSTPMSFFSCPRPAVLDLSKVPDFQANNAVVGFLDHSGHPLLRHPPRLQKAGEIGALAQLGNAKLHRSGEVLPIPVAITVALR